MASNEESLMEKGIKHKVLARLLLLIIFQLFQYFDIRIEATIRVVNLYVIPKVE